MMVFKYMKPQNELLKNLEKMAAVITDSHIVYTSGKHGSAYVNKDAIYPHTELTSRLCLEIAQHFSSRPIDVVIAPAVGGIILSQWIAFHLTQITGKEVLGVYAEKDETTGSFVIKRGYDLLCRSKNVLVVEDVLTTGGSVKKVVEVLRTIPAHVVGVAALCNRGGVTPHELGEIPELFSLINIQLNTWDKESCPLCEKHVPINTQVGKGREYLEKNKNS